MVVLIKRDVVRTPKKNRLALFLTTAICSAAAIPKIAVAQGVPTASPPVFQQVDPNGVDIISGQFHTTGPSIFIGGDDSHLKAVIKYDSVFLDTGTAPLLSITTIGPSKDAYISFDDITEYFVDTGLYNYTPNKDGSTLSYSSATKIFTFTSKSGVKIYFDENINSSSLGFGSVYPSSMKYPDGESITYVYDKRDISEVYPVIGAYTISAVSLITASSNLGYDIRFNWDFSNITNYGKGWTAVSSVNRAQDYCNPSSVSCLTTRSWPTISRTRPTSATQQLTDPNGGVWRFTFDGTSRVVGIKRPTSASVDNVIITYDSMVRVSTLAIGSDTWSYAYTTNYAATPSPTGTTTVTDPQGGQTVYSYVLGSYLTSVKDPLNRVTSFGHDANGRVTSQTMPEGNQIQYAYDSRSNVTSVTVVPKPSVGGVSIVTSASYPSTCPNPLTCNQPTYIQDAKGNQTDYTYDSSTGLPLTITSPASTSGAVRPQTRYSYTALQAYYKNSGGSIVASGMPVTKLTGISSCQTMVSCTGAADEVRTTIGYGAQAPGTANNLLPVSVTKGGGDGVLATTTITAYDVIGNAVSTDGPLSGAADTTVMRYDAGRRLIGIVGPDPDAGGVLKHRAQRMTYNADDQVALTERGTVDSQSDADWAAFAPLETLATTYDSNGRQATVRRRSGGTDYSLTQYSYDSLGRSDCVAVRMNAATWGALPSGCALGTVGSAGPDRITKKTYDAAGELTKVQTAFGTADQTDEQTSTYSNNGALATLTDGNGNKTTYEYDGFDRLMKTRYPSLVAGSGVSSSTDYEQIVYDSNGNVTSRRLRGYASDGTQHIDFTYDNLNRVVFKDVPDSGGDVSYSYDLLGRMTLAATSGQSIYFAYDALGRRLSESGAVGPVLSQYDLAGRRTYLTWPDGFYVAYDYMATGEITAIRENGATFGAGVLATYAYDNLGRRTNLTRGNGTSTSYGYDNVSRLSSLNQDLASTAYDQSLGFSYNPANQIISATRSNDAYAWTGSATGNQSYTVNGLNQATAVGAGAITYDARGNLSATGANAYTYSSENLLRTGPASNVLNYDPLLRLFQVNSTDRFGYDGQDMIGEYTSSNLLTRRYVHGPSTDEPLVWYEGAGTTDRRWLHADERGSIVAVTNGAGAVIGIDSYDEYGVPASGNIGRFQYTGQSYIPEFGMYNYKARIYSSRLGRFLQPDPIGYGSGMNMYGYVNGDPVNATDPTGLTSLCGLDSLGRGQGQGSCDAPGLPWITVTAGGLFGSTIGIMGGGSRFDYGFPMGFGASIFNLVPPQISNEKSGRKSEAQRLKDLQKEMIAACAKNQSSAECKRLKSEYGEKFSRMAREYPLPVPKNGKLMRPDIGELGVGILGCGVGIGSGGTLFVAGVTAAGCAYTAKGVGQFIVPEESPAYGP